MVMTAKMTMMDSRYHCCARWHPFSLKDKVIDAVRSNENEIDSLSTLMEGQGD